ncbi:MAG TPA: cobalamin-binding protein [Blastocatellia bacterium]|jgi:iron complex transport system substrate-binding protein|nr:cobalamin-binding protein [Spartobacteria bacterium]HCP91288.1 cobalamin-binding protein [Spartobacteria bacterium]HCX31371.1 cobalamin-binding protein [Blastocatellia bacterium]
MRIISLLASGTEIVCGLGAGHALVGRSHECDNPDWVRKLPVCTRPAFDIEMSSKEIDAEVRRRLKENEPLYHIDCELIRQLEPDLLITQEHCEVCAVTPADVARTGCESLAEQVLALSAGTILGIYDGILAVGKAINRTSAAHALVADIQQRIDKTYQAVRKQSAPTVVILEWTDPIFPTGNWGPELVEAANGKLLLGGKGEHSRAISWGRVREADPDYLIVAPCGYNLSRSMREIRVLEALPGWFELTAVKRKQMAFADGNKFFNRSGTTIADTVEIIAEILHGYRLRGSWEGSAWQRYARTGEKRALQFAHS